MSHDIESDYMKEYDSFWRPLIEDANGVINVDKVARELADYSQLIMLVSQVYCELTNSRISKPFTNPQAVIDEVNDINQAAFEDWLEDEIECGNLIRIHKH
jgi:hypothetical protein